MRESPGDTALEVWVEPLAGGFPLEIAGAALVLLRRGSLTARSASDALRLRAGELLAVPLGASARLSGPSSDCAGFRFHAGSTWVRAAAVVLARPLAERAAALGWEPAASATSRRVSRVLLGLPAGAGRRQLAGASAVELLEAVLDARPLDESVLAPRGLHSRKRAQVVRALAELATDADAPDFSLGGLAARVGLSPRQTARLFQSETGLSFRRYRSVTRLEAACKLLVTTELPIAEVALGAGWSSLGSFYDSFRRATGMSPARYRQAESRQLSTACPSA